MSYSRWSNSRWYTFWSCFSEQTDYKLPTNRLKNNQVFEICDDPSYHTTYGDIKKYGTEQIISEVILTYANDKKIPPTHEELDELEGYLKRFVDDVDTHFKLTVFFRYEWYYPFRNKVLRKWKTITKK